MSDVKRRYRSPRREEQAQATRRAILDAALELFTAQGYTATTMRGIARCASVSEQTVYNAFGDKVGLLLAALESYSELAAGQANAAFLEDLAGEPDPVERIRMVAASSRATWVGGVIELERMIFGQPHTDLRLQKLARIGLAQKHADTRAACEILFPDAIRRPGLDLERIAAFATAIDSAAVVTTLQALGWSLDDWEAWVVKLLCSFLDPRVADRIEE